MTAQELYGQLLYEKTVLHYCYGYAELTQDITMAYFTGRWEQNKPVMVSRLGDLGITEHLEATHGYGRRTLPDEGLLTSCRRML